MATESEFIVCAQSIRDRMDRIGQILTKLEEQMILAVEDVAVSEYTLNDGQVVIKTAYRSPESIAKAIDHYERIYNRLANRCNGRIFTLKDARSFNYLQRYGKY